MSQPGIINIIGPSVFDSGIGLTNDVGDSGMEMVDSEGEGVVSSTCLSGESESGGGVIVCDGICH